MTPVPSLYRESHKTNTYIEILAVKRLRESTVKEAKKLSDQNVPMEMQEPVPQDGSWFQGNERRNQVNKHNRQP